MLTPELMPLGNHLEEHGFSPKAAKLMENIILPAIGLTPEKFKEERPSEFARSFQEQVGDGGELCLYFPSIVPFAENRICLEKLRTWKGSSIQQGLGVRTLRMSNHFVEGVVSPQDEVRLIRRGVRDVRQLLVGSPFHPFIGHPLSQAFRKQIGLEGKILRRWQRDASHVVAHLANRALKTNTVRNLLIVAPTGTGKTEVSLALLDKQIELNTQHRLHVFGATRTLVLGEFLKNLKGRKFKKPIKIVSWDDIKVQQEFKQRYYSLTEGKEKLTPLGKLSLFLQQHPQSHVILLTTLQSLKNQTGFYDVSETTGQRSHFNRALNALKPHLSTVIVDEAHNALADDCSKVLHQIREKVDHSGVFLGTTATPFHSKNSVGKFFGDKVYFAYHDNAKEFIPLLAEPDTLWKPTSDWDREGQVDAEYEMDEEETRMMEVIPLQLAKAIDSGELQPLSLISTLGTPDFDKSLGEAAPYLAPYILRHHKTFVTCTSTGDADLLTVKLNEYFQNENLRKSFAVYHSKLPLDVQKSVLDSFRDGQLDGLVSVSMLDEGADIPELTLHIEMKRQNDNFKILLQRMGRLLRLNVGKYFTEVVLFHKPSVFLEREMNDPRFQGIVQWAQD